MQRHGWTLLFHEGVIVQLRKLQEAVARLNRTTRKALKAMPTSSCSGP